MRALTAISAGIVLAITAAGEASAKSQRKAAAPVAAASTIPVNNYDPSGNYKDYPDWARRALSPRAGGGGGR